MLRVDLSLHVSAIRHVRYNGDKKPVAVEIHFFERELGWKTRAVLASAFDCGSLRHAKARGASNQRRFEASGQIEEGLRRRADYLICGIGEHRCARAVRRKDTAFAIHYQNAVLRRVDRPRTRPGLRLPRERRNSGKRDPLIFEYATKNPGEEAEGRAARQEKRESHLRAIGSDGRKQEMGQECAREHCEKADNPSAQQSRGFYRQVIGCIGNGLSEDRLNRESQRCRNRHRERGDQQPDRQGLGKSRGDASPVFREPLKKVTAARAHRRKRRAGAARCKQQSVPDRMVKTSR
nr:hypothetical protein [Methylocystis sp. Sn-Cys]